MLLEGGKKTQTKDYGDEQIELPGGVPPKTPLGSLRLGPRMPPHASVYFCSQTSYGTIPDIQRPPGGLGGNPSGKLNLPYPLFASLSKDIPALRPTAR
jgi:hypothetical protein